MDARRVAVITGGSSGIGAAAARTFASAGWTVYELSRSGQDAAGVRHITADVCDEASLRAAFDEVGRREGRLDLLINNAGFGVSGAAELCPPEDARRQMEVNFLGVLACSRLALPLLRESRGRIINISSVAAVFAIPFQSLYSASKAAVNALTLALRNELAPFGVSVCALMLGDVHTGFTDAREKRHGGEELYGERIERSVRVMERDERGGMSPERVARKLLRMAERRRVKPLSSLGLKYRLFLLLGRLLPYSLSNRLVGMMYR